MLKYLTRLNECSGSFCCIASCARSLDKIQHYLDFKGQFPLMVEKCDLNILV